ncbi:unnamed protein product, partial [Timema podura]|nr:unnamed protein product [Timema podura]
MVGGRSERRGAVSQSTEVSFCANKNRWITETVDGANYRTCIAEKSYIMGAALFGLSLWLKFEPGLQDWFDKLSLQAVYTGVYILIVVSALVMIVSFFIALQVVSFILGLAGAAVLLDHTTYDSSLQPLIRNSMNNLISTSQNENSANILRMIQENIGCCGADGPTDYINMKKPLPTECRDTVTGNAFFYGCVEELTWFLEAKSGWVSGIAMALCMAHV